MERRNLPGDLIEEILSRVPAKSLARWRSASKQWNALLKSERFAKKHSANAPKEESLTIMLIDSTVCLVKINLHGFHNYVAPSVKVASQFYLKDPLFTSSQVDVDIRNVFHCDGLLLCTTKDYRLVVWNPCSGETKWIKPRDSYTESDYYALGYDNKSSCKQYKILRLRVHSLDGFFNNEYEIYDFTSDSWRVLGVTTDWFLSKSRRGISMKGNTYWVTFDNTQGSPYPDILLSFDFSTERFQSLSLPLLPYMEVALSVVREEQLCLLGLNSERLHVWVATSTGSVLSWSKFLTLMKGNYTLISCEYGKSFLVDEKNKVVMWCNDDPLFHIVGENKQIGLVPHGGDSTRKSSCSVFLNYVPTLAQIQQDTLLGGRTRKAPSM